MAAQIVGKRIGHDIALADYLFVIGEILAYFGEKQGVMGACQNYSVNILVSFHQGVYLLLDEIVGSRACPFAVLYERNPHRATVPHCDTFRILFGYFNIVRTALNRAGCSENTYMMCGGKPGDRFGRGADNAKHTPVRGDGRKGVLLDSAQRFG